MVSPLISEIIFKEEEAIQQSLDLCDQEHAKMKRISRLTHTAWSYSQYLSEYNILHSFCTCKHGRPQVGCVFVVEEV